MSILFVLLGAGGVGGWWFFLRDPGTGKEPTPQVAVVTPVSPTQPNQPAPVKVQEPTKAPDKTEETTVEQMKKIRRLLEALNLASDARGRMPSPSNGKGLSWRVFLLPELGQQALFDQFKIDEPWDSDHNMGLLEKMPAVFQSAGEPSKPGHTHFQYITGPLTLFPKQDFTVRLPRNFPDGSSTTSLLLEARQSVPWTKPEDIALQNENSKLEDFKQFPLGPFPPLGHVNPNGFVVGLANVDVLILSHDATDPVLLSHLVCPYDGKPLPESFEGAILKRYSLLNPSTEPPPVKTQAPVPVLKTKPEK